MKKLKMSFGFSAVNAGQRAANVEPQLVAVSTEGGFRLTGAVTRVLGIVPGDYVMFISNLAQIDQAITAKAEELVAFCEEQGLEFGTPEAVVAIHKEFDMWAVAKGILERDTKGNAKECTERLSKKDKQTYVSQNFESMLEAALASDNEELVAALTREDITKEEQMDILVSTVVGKTLPKYKGSKCANPAGLSGSGLTLTFTDSNVWKQLKADLRDEASTKNRVYGLNLDDVQDIVISDGYEDVTVKALILDEYTDAEPSRRGGDDEAAADNEE